MIDRPKVDSKWPKDQELYFVGARCQAAFKNTDFAVGVFIKLVLVHYTPVPPEAQQLRNFYNTQSSDRWHIMTIVIHGNYEIVIADQHDTRFIIPHTSQVAIITSSTITTILPSPSSDFGKKIVLWSTHNLWHQINHIIHRNGSRKFARPVYRICMVCGETWSCGCTCEYIRYKTALPHHSYFLYHTLPQQPYHCVSWTWWFR